ncbi:MAG: glycoside hydrolase, family 31, partial [Phycisphaerales bacterium]|nr:glycoside hydrolase, family 31 [Phycisphaerales bacterium]
AFGVLYSDTINKVFRRIGRRTFGSVRSLGALASPLPYVLYSDLYNHRDFLRGMATAGVCGLLWTPEVRDATSAEDLVRRIQSVILSPQALINSWYIPMPPWEQTDIAANARGERMAGWEACEALVRDVLILRMRLIPYIYTAFAKYYFDGVPPFRPLVLEDPCDESLRDVSDQYMVGSSLLVAPMVSGEAERKIVLPKGDWMDFATDELFHGGQTITYFSPIERVPIFVRANTLLPMAEPVQCVRSDTVFRIIARAFGTPLNSAVLFEDDGESFAFEQGHYNWVTVQHDGSMTRRGSYDGPARYMPMVPIL